ncbi:hypothetical protein DPMN_102855 [Dreissena polymorpha]|uniref:Uncharacterized protein n=1 Tax=Dreissena polymorpha TaxID=45954 RepID=A0A9D4H6S7_DREPO|nr:hypothetical protein DPMN_102855 [Dreissena polymorpha]
MMAKSTFIWNISPLLDVKPIFEYQFFSSSQDALPETQWPAKTMLLISMCFPYGVWLLVYSSKSLFGSSTWPSFSLLSSVGTRGSRSVVREGVVV